MTPDLSEVGQRAREADGERFRAAFFAPPDQREGLFAVIALNAELARIPVTVSEPLLGEIRLQWWRDAVEDLLQNGVRLPHEVLAALPGNLSGQTLAALIDARQFDIHDAPMKDRAALDAYLAATGGGVARLMAEAAGAQGPALDIAGEAGWAEGAGRLIEALPRLYHEGISAIPVDGVLDLNALAEGQMPDGLGKAVCDLAEEALDRLSKARRERRHLSGGAGAACLSAHVFEATLRAATRPGFTIYTSPPRPSPFAARLNLVWRGATGRF